MATKDALNPKFGDVLLGQSTSEQTKNIDGCINNLVTNDDTLADTIDSILVPDGNQPLFDGSQKINTIYLPDTVFGSMEYKGTFNANTATSVTGLNKGDYYICIADGSKNPDGTSITSSLGAYTTGDWAVYNGSGWDKIDNTDAVMLVNGQKGNVETYKGAYSSSTQYFKGDIVLSSGILYLCITKPTSNNVPVTNTTYWKEFGKLYANATSSEDGLMSKSDKSKLDGIAAGANNYTHPAGNAASKTLGFYKISTDGTSHVNSVEAVKKSDITALGIPAQDTTYSPATETANGLMSAMDKKKLNAIDSSLEGVTADEIGKVKDVTVNGSSVLNLSTGVAAITIDDVKAEFINVATSDNVWATQIISGTTYQAIKLEETDTALSVFNSAGQELVIQKIHADGFLYLCVGTSKIACTIRKVKGSSVETSTTSNVANYARELYMSSERNANSIYVNSSGLYFFSLSLYFEDTSGNQGDWVQANGIIFVDPSRNSVGFITNDDIKSYSEDIILQRGTYPSLKYSTTTNYVTVDYSYIRDGINAFVSKISYVKFEEL